MNFFYLGPKIELQRWADLGRHENGRAKYIKGVRKWSGRKSNWKYPGLLMNNFNEVLCKWVEFVMEEACHSVIGVSAETKCEFNYCSTNRNGVLFSIQCKYNNTKVGKNDFTCPVILNLYCPLVGRLISHLFFFLTMWFWILARPDSMYNHTNKWYMSIYPYLISIKVIPRFPT